MQKIVITGATSFLGKYIVNELSKQPDTMIYTIIRPTSKQTEIFQSNPSVTTVLANMGDVEDWSTQIPGADAFIHLGWDGVGAEGRGNMQIQEKNVADAVQCMRGAVALGCKTFLFAGSQAEYGPQTEKITEETLCNPVINYGKAKWIVCQQLMEMAEQLHITYYHTRIFSVYGIGDHPWTLVNSCIRTLCAGEQMKLSSCMQKWNFLHAEDAARYICALLRSSAPTGIYHIASRDTRILKSFVEQIQQACGGTGMCLYGSYDPAEKPVNLIPDVSKLEKAIGRTEEKSFKEGLSQMVAHYQTTGEL